MSRWIEVTESGTGEKGYVRADLVSVVVPHRSSATRVFVSCADDPIPVDETPATIMTRLAVVDTLCPLCGGTGSEIIAGAFVPCGTCGGDGRI